MDLIKCQLILISTVGKSYLRTFLDESHNSKLSLETDEWVGHGNRQLLVVTDNVRIFEGDWYLDDSNLIRKSITSDKYYWNARPNYKKIIASTDSNLDVPFLNKNFLRQYVDSWNDYKLINNIWVEFHNNYCETYERDVYIPKTIDNHILIKNVHEYFTWKEVELMLSEFICTHCPDTSSKLSPGMFINKWIDNNLK